MASEDKAVLNPQDPEDVDQHSVEDCDKPSALEQYQCEKYVFILAGLSLSIPFATYLSYVNVYGAEFDRSVLSWMSFCVFGSAVIIVILQECFDERFNAMYAAEAYTFRINLGLFNGIVVLFAIPFVSQAWHVYILGICCGTFQGAALSSMNQLASSIHPEMHKYGNTGMSFGQAIPAVFSAALGFHDAHALFRTKLLYAWLPAILPLSAFVVLILVTRCYRLEGFDQAFQRIQMRSSGNETESQPGESTPLVANKGASSSSQVSVSSSTSNSWSWLQAGFLTCAVLQFVTHGLARAMLPFLAYVGDLTLAHFLVLNSFISELAGRMASHAVTLDTLGSQKSKNIVYLVLLTLVRVGAGVLLVLQAFKRFDLGVPCLHGLVSLFYFFYGWVAAELLTASVEMGPQEERHNIGRGMTFFNFSGQLVSLCIAVPIVVLALGPSFVPHGIGA